MGGPNLIIQWCKSDLTALLALFVLIGKVTTKWLKASTGTRMQDFFCDGGLIGLFVTIENLYLKEGACSEKDCTGAF